MRGVILAGGTGSRLFPLTKAINKHLLPVYDKPMIFYPIETLKIAGITDILIVLGGESAGEFVKTLGSGRELGVRLTYRYQDEAGGIAQALGLARDFVGSEKVMVLLGDNIIEDNLYNDVQNFVHSQAKAGIFLKQVTDPERFGVAEIRDGKVINIVEKPKVPKSDFAVTGIYLYHPKVFDIVQTLKPSGRGELEITDVNNAFIMENELTAYFLKGYWTDAGKFSSLFRASQLVKEAQER